MIKSYRLCMIVSIFFVSMKNNERLSFQHWNNLVKVLEVID